MLEKEGIFADGGRAYVIPFIAMPDDIEDVFGGLWLPEFSMQGMIQHLEHWRPADELEGIALDYEMDLDEREGGFSNLRIRGPFYKGSLSIIDDVKVVTVHEIYELPGYREQVERDFDVRIASML